MTFYINIYIYTHKHTKRIIKVYDTNCNQFKLLIALAIIHNIDNEFIEHVQCTSNPFVPVSFSVLKSKIRISNGQAKNEKKTADIGTEVSLLITKDGSSQ